MAMSLSTAGRIGAHVSWSRTTDRAARTAPARSAFMVRFEREVDPDGSLPEDERRQRAEHAKRAYMQRLAQSSARARARTDLAGAERVNTGDRSEASPVVGTPRSIHRGATA